MPHCLHKNDADAPPAQPHSGSRTTYEALTQPIPLPYRSGVLIIMALYPVCGRLCVLRFETGMREKGAVHAHRSTNRRVLPGRLLSLLHAVVPRQHPSRVPQPLPSLFPPSRSGNRVLAVQVHQPSGSQSPSEGCRNSAQAGSQTVADIRADLALPPHREPIARSALVARLHEVSIQPLGEYCGCPILNASYAFRVGRQPHPHFSAVSGSSAESSTSTADPGVRSKLTASSPVG
jgi:hypothetical protein